MNVRTLGTQSYWRSAGMSHAIMDNMAAKDNKLQGTCSVCLRPIQLHGSHPVRHGFSAVGVRHGQSSGHHTGPCAGAVFPHLGISTEGTQWAIDRARGILDELSTAHAKLDENPDLTWYPKKYDVRGGRSDLSRPVIVKYGDKAPFVMRFDTPPSYADLQRERVAALERQERKAEHEITEYERVLANWSPEKYPTIGAPAKVETVHMERPIAIRGETVAGVLCKGLKAMRGQRLLKTSDPAKVTCKRCRATLGLPPL